MPSTHSPCSQPSLCLKGKWPSRHSPLAMLHLLLCRGKGGPLLLRAMGSFSTDMALSVARLGQPHPVWVSPLSTLGLMPERLEGLLPVPVPPLQHLLLQNTIVTWPLASWCTHHFCSKVALFIHFNSVLYCGDIGSFFSIWELE